MGLLELLKALDAAHARLEGVGDKLRVTSPGGLAEPLRAAVAASKPQLLEALRRAETMLSRVLGSVIGMPVLTVRDVSNEPGHCCSCGEPSTGFRCELCLAAATIAAERYRSAISLVASPAAG